MPLLYKRSISWLGKSGDTWCGILTRANKKWSVNKWNWVKNIPLKDKTEIVKLAQGLYYSLLWKPGHERKWRYSNFEKCDFRILRFNWGKCHFPSSCPFCHKFRCFSIQLLDPIQYMEVAEWRLIGRPIKYRRKGMCKDLDLMGV